MKRLIKKATKLILYHGTKSDNIENIIQNGLTPNNSGDCAQNDAIYLTNDKSIAMDYADSGADFKTLYPAIITCSVDTNNFRPDDDWAFEHLEEMLTNALNKEEITEDEAEEVIRKAEEAGDRQWSYTDGAFMVPYFKYLSWEQCLRETNNIAHIGVIPINQIERIDIYYDKTNFKTIKNININEYYKIIEEIKALN